MNSEISAAAICYGLYDEDKIVGFMGVLHQPHAKNRKIKRVTRLVILPDYQGIGLGYKFLCLVAKHYKSNGWDFSIVTSAKNLIYKLNASKQWICVRYGVNKKATSQNAIDANKSSLRTKCKTASFFYKGDD